VRGMLVARRRWSWRVSGPAPTPDGERDELKVEPAKGATAKRVRHAGLLDEGTNVWSRFISLLFKKGIAPGRWTI